MVVSLDMKTTIDIPDEIYRQVKARSAREGRSVRDVTLGLFRGWIGDVGRWTFDVRPYSAPRDLHSRMAFRISCVVACVLMPGTSKGEFAVVL